MATARILLADDEERYRKNLAQRLTLRGYQVEQAGDGEEAVRLAIASQPDVVILDRKMPKKDGEQVLQEIKKALPSVHIIMLTGHASIQSAMHSGRYDAFAYLEKPCQIDELICTIEAALHQGEPCDSSAD